MVPDLAREMGSAYPRLAEQEARIIEVLRAEEERFFETLEKGMALLAFGIAWSMLPPYGENSASEGKEFKTKAKTPFKALAHINNSGKKCIAIPSTEQAFKKPCNGNLSNASYIYPEDWGKAVGQSGTWLSQWTDVIDEAKWEDEKRAGKKLDGGFAFQLHDTYGFPLDLTQDVCRERGVTVDVAGFNAAMQQQKDTARAAGKFKMDKLLEYEGPAGLFTGYDEMAHAACRVTALYADGQSVGELKAGQAGVVVLDTTPFYAESGGQVGDAGWLTAPGVVFEVADTQKIKAGVHGHHGALTQGALKVGDAVQAQVDTQRRQATMRNHSVTHLMHKALREVLGSHVQQKGSLVDAAKTRFDFTHGAPVTPEEIAEIERRVNAEILANTATQARVMDIDSARETGAMMLFGEKYGDTVRVLDIGASRELCGGTHVARTGDIGLFKIVMESGVAAGIRRVEAITGLNALNWAQATENAVQSAAAALHAPAADLQGRLRQTLDHIKTLEKEVAQLKGRLASAQGGELASQAVSVHGVQVLAARLDGADAQTLRETMDKLKDKLKTAAIVLAATSEGKVQLAAGVTPDTVGRIKAGELVNFVAQQVGGKGGGKPDMAMAGGTDASKLPAALHSVQAWVAEKIG